MKEGDGYSHGCLSCVRRHRIDLRGRTDTTRADGLSLFPMRITTFPRPLCFFMRCRVPSSSTFPRRIRESSLLLRVQTSSQQTEGRERERGSFIQTRPDGSLTLQALIDMRSIRGLLEAEQTGKIWITIFCLLSFKWPNERNTTGRIKLLFPPFFFFLSFCFQQLDERLWESGSPSNDANRYAIGGKVIRISARFQTTSKYLTT